MLFLKRRFRVTRDGREWGIPPVAPVAVELSVKGVKPQKWLPIRLAVFDNGVADTLQITLPDNRRVLVEMTLKEAA